VAAAGKKEYPLPMYANAALRDPMNPGPAGTYESGGATDNVLWIWKVAAPALDVLAPDIYQGDSVKYRKVLELYSPAGQPAVRARDGRPAGYPRGCVCRAGTGAIGWSPFGLDYTSYSTEPQGMPRMAEEALAPIALNYKMLEPIMREAARLNFEGKLQAVAEEQGQARQTLDFGNWKAVVTFGAGGRNNSRQRQPHPHRPRPGGQTRRGIHCRVDFETAGKQREFIKVEEEADQPLRIWNGDQTDWGLNFTSAPQVLRVTLRTY
jgi:hypothetical protein